MTAAEAGVPALALHDVTMRFPGVIALKGISLEVNRAEVHAICGENGAGKSTLISILGGILPHGWYEGGLTLHGEPYEPNGVRAAEAQGIVVIHQELALCGNLSIADNIFLGHELTGGMLLKEEEAHERTSALLARVGLAVEPGRPAADLGIGQQQLVEIAKALAKDVRILILDEPTAALNDDDSDHLLGIIAQLRGEGTTCILVSHKLAEVRRIADRVTVIRDGAAVETLTIEEATEERIIRGMVGRDLEHRYPPREVSMGAEVLHVKDWTVPTLEDPERISGVNLSIRAGEIVGLCGLVGSGRTELAMSIFGRSFGGKPSGHLRIGGLEVSTPTVPDAIRAGLAYVTEDRKQLGLDLGSELRNNLTIVGLKKILRRGFIDDELEAGVVKKLMSRFGIRAANPSVAIGTLSGGNQQKALLGRWVLTDPKVLILDEPTRGVDVGAKYEIYSAINDLASRGVGVLLISSEIEELLGMADRIMAMSEGRISGELPARTASPESLMQLMTKEMR
ncbi:ATP-binding cassette domain-containing protein [Amnibacterium flavum]|uniref:ABC transporter ATP-binding protein n=1 Tax=Amnibacterium flavum TaxID=2173173 RepID=A0A2V1HKV1_9MICO|nr:sugar ABC transporter ATP-binding protein [Amnibacterium flavum]PVZ93243.1 ABC transporter ATP-binding protein [Amnibacterium flavum]